MAKSRIKKNTRIGKRKKGKKRKKEKARKILKGVGKLSLSFLMIAGLAVAGKKVEDFLLTSPYFRINEVIFEGLNSLDKKTVEYLAEIELGKNIFQVDREGIRRRLQSHPQVQEVIVCRKFPRRMEVKVKEREAIALIESDGKMYPVDREGVVISEVTLSRLLPLITGLGKRKIEVGKRMEGAKLVTALEALEDFSSRGLSFSKIDLEKQSPVVWMGEINPVRSDPPQAVSKGDCLPGRTDAVRRGRGTSNGVKIFLGRGREDREKKLRELQSILSDIGKREEKAEYIDLRFSNPVVKIARDNRQ